MTKIAVIGFGGHTKSLINLLLSTYNSQAISIFDDSFREDKQEAINLIPLAGRIDRVKDSQDVILSIGDNNLRKKYFIYFEKQIIRNSLFHTSQVYFSSLFHPFEHS